MKYAFLVYKTDTWHSNDSKELLGVANDMTIAIQIVKEQIVRDKEPDMSEYTLNFLRDFRQTQDYSGEGEFIIDRIDCDKLI